MQDNNDKQTILLIDDDIKYCRLIKDYLSGFGYEIESVHNGKDGLETALNNYWSAVILDLMLPGIDGLEVLKQLRESSQIPILMLTALGSESDRIIGLEFGADDYVPKTSSPRELLARLRAILRRSRFSEEQFKKEEDSGSISVGPLLIDLNARQAYLSDEPVVLTPVEYELLLVLARAIGRVKTREQILNEVRDRNYDAFDRSIDVHISSLRKKLGDSPKQPSFIKTVRGAGYMLSPWKKGS